MRPYSVALIGALGAVACGPPSELGRDRARLGSDVPKTVYVVLDGPPAAKMVRPGESGVAAAPRVRQRLAELETQRALLRPEIEARGATIVGEMSRLANAFMVRAPESELEAIARLPGVQRIEEVPIVEPQLATAVPLVRAPELWSSAYDGAGMRIGIVDTGVDYTHADLGGSGNVADYQSNDRSLIEPGTFPTLKVVDGWDFAGDAYNASDPSADNPAPDPDPLDCGGHGSHVAGIAAGNGVLASNAAFTGPYQQSLDLLSFKIAPGVAPRASIYAFKVFGCGGSTSLSALAFERASDPNNDGDFSDRLDAVNASLGASYGPPSVVNTEVVENLISVGSVLVAASGNDGNTFFITATPGNSPHALSVAATGDFLFVTLRVDAPAEITGSYLAAEATFTAQLRQTGPVSGPIVYADPPDGCTPPTNVAGAIALVDRGSCAFVDKLMQTEIAGAIATIVVNHELDEAPFPMSGTGTSNIPAVMIARPQGDALKAAAGVEVTLLPDRFTGDGSEFLAGFSSRGPSSRGTILKPELSAPGSDIQSAEVGSGTEIRNSSGTSMATPMVTGAVALLRQAHPTLSPRQVKAALMNSAQPTADSQGRLIPISLQGAGRLDIAAATEGTVRAFAETDDGTVAVSFGAVTVDEPTMLERNVSIESDAASPIDMSAAIEPFHALPGVELTVEPTSFTLAPGGVATVKLRLAVDPASLGEPPPDPLTAVSQFELPRHHLHEAAGRLLLTAAAGEQPIGLPFYAAVRPAARLETEVPFACADDAVGERLLVPIGGSSAHPDPVSSAFELGGIDEPDPRSPSDPYAAMLDILAYGAATDAARYTDVADASVYFAIAVAGEWSTPAQGLYSVVAIELDTDGNLSPDKRTMAEAFRQEEPFADVLVATTYDLMTGEQVGSKRLLNMASAADAATHPFHNSVLVFPVFARDIGIDERNTTVRYRAVSIDPTIAQYGDDTVWATLDTRHPLIDTTPLEPAPGRPLYRKGELIAARIDRAASPQMLVLHHDNVAGERFEVLDLAEFGSEQATLSAQVPASLAIGDRAVIRLRVTNDGEQPLVDARLETTIAGAVLEVIAPSQGSCEKLNCALGRIEPGSSAEVGLYLGASADGDASVDVRFTSASGCAQEQHLKIGPRAADPGTSLDPSGGCGCRMVGVPGDRRHHAALLLLALFIALRRRHFRRAARA